eukprot:gene5489-5556_t
MRHDGSPSRLCKASMASSITSCAQLSKPLEDETAPPVGSTCAIGYDFPMTSSVAASSSGS